MEIRQLQRALSDARRPHGTAIFLVGEEGIGKSRLAAEAVRLARADGMHVMRGRGSQLRPEVPFGPLSEALSGLLRTGAPPAGGALGPYLGVLGSLVPYLASGADLEFHGAPSVLDLAEAVLRLTAAAGSTGGCLFVLEDLHDVASETLAVVEYLADNIDLQPTVMLATVRAGLGPASELAHAAAMRGSGHLITLGRLARDEVGALAAAFLDVRPQDVPGQVLRRLWRDSAGNPAVVRELLDGMVSARLLVIGPDGVRLAGAVKFLVPGYFAQSIARRAARFGPSGLRVLTTAAIFGQRFPLAVVQAVTGIADEDLQAVLRGAAGDGLVEACEQDWYRFTHPLAATALLRELTPAGRAAIARRAAEAIESDPAGLAGRWPRVVAMLRLKAGDRAGASRVLAAEGSRALASGFLGRAIVLLNLAWKLLADTGADSSLRADIISGLLTALGETGQVSQVRRLTARLDELSQLGLSSVRLAELHARAGLVAAGTGHLAEAAIHAEVAWNLLAWPKPADGGFTALLLAVIAAQSPGEEQAAERLAALAIAGESNRPEVACQLWEVSGRIARRHDLDKAAVCFERCQELAARHGLPIWKMRAQAQLAMAECVTGRGDDRVWPARREAARLGAAPLRCELEIAAALAQVLRGEYEQARELTERCWSEARQFALNSQAMQVAMVRATLAAHQGQREEMNEALAEFRRLGGHSSHLASLSLGLASAFCALVEDDLELARRDLAAAVARDAVAPGSYPLAGTHGLHPLFQVLAGEGGWPEYEVGAAGPAGSVRWNLQFALLARAVLLGRESRESEAMEAMNQAGQAAAPFPLAHHLGLRLAAQAAHADGWGEPALWLRRAEEHFHSRKLAPAAAGCRGLLRQIGASVPHRRPDLDRVPAALRKLGVTSREFDVLRLLASRLGNKAIADALFISPRTAEKHVASLLLKTGLRNRADLIEKARNQARNHDGAASSDQ